MGENSQKFPHVMTWVYIGPKEDQERDEKDIREIFFFSHIFSNKTERLRRVSFYSLESVSWVRKKNTLIFSLLLYWTAFQIY